MADFIFRKYKPEDKEQVLALLGNALWHFPYEERLAYFNWKYEQNPYTESPLGFVCVDGEKIIAFRGYMTQILSLSGKIYYSVASGDTVTDSNYRRLGVFLRMTRFSLDELEKITNISVITNSSSGWPASNGCQKLGWVPLTERGHLFSFTWRTLFPKHNIPSSCRRIKGDIRMELTTECRDVEMGRLAESKIPNDLISVYTDENYISWRYANPRSRYYFAYFYKHEELKSYVVLKKIANRKYDLVDYQCETKKQLRSLLFELHKWLNPLYILNWIVNKNDMINKSPIRLGFINLNFMLNRISKFRTPPFLVRTTIVDQCEQDWLIVGDVDMRNVANWNLNKVVADEI